MQTQKAQNRKRIIEAATREFYEKGYRRSSMREIAKQAGMTVGNIYAYFHSKDVLFGAVVSPTVEQFEQLITSIPLPRFNEESPLRYVAQAVSGLYQQNRLQFMILMDGAAGSEFESAKDRITMEVCHRIWAERELLPDSFRENPVLVDALGCSLIEAMVYILLHYRGDIRQLEETLNQFLSYLFVKKPPELPAGSEC